MRSTAACYDELRDYCERLPLVDCHDHTSRPVPHYGDPVQIISAGYCHSDLLSATSDAELDTMRDYSLPLEQRWPVIERAWRRTCHTGYARVTRMVLEHFYGESELTLDALKRIRPRMMNFEDRATFERVLEEAGIAARVTDMLEFCHTTQRQQTDVFEGRYELPPRARFVISLPSLHGVRSCEDIQGRIWVLGRRVTSLGEYVEALRELLAGYKAAGAVACKDQSAYSRPISYGNPTRAQAEEVFNWLMADPRRSASYPDGVRPLDDFLFHELLRMARDLELPVQVHTGHMAGIRNDVAKTNAAHLTSVLELHREVQFDLFHANWPYGGEVLFLAKNYPNVAIDFCWTNIIDPVYTVRLLQQALASVPHGKIHGFGSDFVGNPDRAWAHARIARDNIATALAEMVQADYIGLDDARQVARMWLFDNPNEFFKLGVPFAERSLG